MIQNLDGFCYLAFGILALLSPLMPLFLMWRLAGLSAFAFAAGKLIEGPIHWSDQNISYFMGTIILFLFSLGISILIIIKLAIAAGQKKLSAHRLIGPQSRLMRYCDCIALVAIGWVIGLYLMVFLARLLSSVSIGKNLDLCVAILAFAIAISAFALSAKNVRIVVFGIWASLGVSALIGSKQPDTILKSAEAFADGRAWCLTAPVKVGPISNLRQLGFFALPKGTSVQHLILMVQEDDRLRPAAHWSIRQQNFFEIGDLSGGAPACSPIKDFREALENGTLKQR